jgi:hypothetical protein
VRFAAAASTSDIENTCENATGFAGGQDQAVEGTSRSAHIGVVRNAAVYASGVYAARGTNPTTNARDGIFSDSLGSELAAVSGDPINGYAAAFTVAIAG